MTQTRATLAVPSPATSLSLGKEWSGTDWNNAGLCVNTEARVWLQADGAKDSSTLSALANGGQLLLQSLSTNLYLFSAQSNVVAASGSVLIAGGDGVKIVTGQGSERFFGVGSTSIDAVAPDDADPTSDHAQAYVGYMDDVAEYWSIADASLGAAMIVLESVMQIAGLRVGGSSANTAMAALGLATAGKLAGGAVDMARVGGADPPSLHIASWSDVNFNTTGFASFYAGAGMMLGGIRVDGLGFLDAAVTAGLGASLKSGYSSIEGKQVDMTAGVEFTGASSCGELKLYGGELYVGAVGGEAATQLPTKSITASALTSIEVNANLGAITQTAGGPITYDADKVTVSAQASVVISSPAYEVKVSALGIEIALMKTVKIGVAGTGIKASVQGMTTFAMEAAGVKIGNPAAGLQVDATGSWLIKGPQINFL